MSSTKKLEKYEAYVNEVLRVDLDSICKELDRVITDFAEYEQLGNVIELLKEYKTRNEVFKTLTDIGCSFFMQTNVEDPSSILLNIGYGYYLEFTLDEALMFVRAKQKLLDTRITGLRNNSAKVKAHIKLLLMYMDKFNNPQSA